MKKVGELVKEVSKKVAVNNTNTASTYYSYQAKEPEALQKFKKVR